MNRRGVGIAIVFLTALGVGCSTRPASAPIPASPTPEAPTPEDMVAIPAGHFVMGCDADDPECDTDEKPAHDVELRVFAIDRYEVTNARYDACVTAGACERTRFRDDPRFAGLNQPVVGARWTDATAYCAWRGARLPTEAEWEYAARADSRWFRENGLDTVAWYKDFTDRPHDVGQKLPNPWGLYDMLGNAWEWAADVYGAEYFAVSPKVDPRGPETGDQRVLRGGSWFNGSTNTRISVRHGAKPDDAADMRGFRCATSRG